jgi:hypothetical protein
VSERFSAVGWKEFGVRGEWAEAKVGILNSSADDQPLFHFVYVKPGSPTRLPDSRQLFLSPTEFNKMLFFSAQQSQFSIDSRLNNGDRIGYKSRRTEVGNFDDIRQKTNLDEIVKWVTDECMIYSLHIIK